MQFRLRNMASQIAYSSSYLVRSECGSIMKRAADKIDRLEAEIAKLKEKKP